MFEIKVKTGNDIFVPDPAIELARILREVADKVEQNLTSGKCMDSNGNTVGHWALK